MIRKTNRKGFCGSIRDDNFSSGKTFAKLQTRFGDAGAPASIIRLMLPNFMAFHFTVVIDFFPMTGEQKADDIWYFTIVCTSFSALAFAGFVGFISGITDVTPNAG